MRDQLLDLVKHTYGLGVIDIVKLTSTEDETTVDSIANDNSVVLHAEFKRHIPGLVGVFGMPQLNKLSTILNISEYKDHAKLTVSTQVREGQRIPEGLHFENARGDFQNDFRFMSQQMVTEKLKIPRMKSVIWEVVFEPTLANIQRLKFQTLAHNDDTQFAARTEKGDLKFFFGDHSSHAGSFVFAEGVGDVLHTPLRFPIAIVNSILGLAGGKVFQISNSGVAQITVDSGLATYTYMLPAQTK